MFNDSISIASTRRRVVRLPATTAVGMRAQQNKALTQPITTQPVKTQAPSVGAIRPEPKRGPRQELDLVASFVGLAHKDRNLSQVADMVSRDTKLVYACWDWGGGDWETGLGSASHVGSRKMARFLAQEGPWRSRRKLRVVARYLCFGVRSAVGSWKSEREQIDGRLQL
jgi:hypothetical protein